MKISPFYIDMAIVAAIVLLFLCSHIQEGLFHSHFLAFLILQSFCPFLGDVSSAIDAGTVRYSVASQ